MNKKVSYFSDILAHERGAEYCPEVAIELSLYYKGDDELPETVIDGLTIDGREADEALESKAFREELGRELLRTAEAYASDVATEHYQDFGN